MPPQSYFYICAAATCTKDKVTQKWVQTPRANDYYFDNSFRGTETWKPWLYVAAKNNSMLGQYKTHLLHRLAGIRLDPPPPPPPPGFRCKTVFPIIEFNKINIWLLVYPKIYLAIYRPLGILRKKIDKSTCKIFTFGHRSERVQTPKNFFYFFSVEFYCGHFNPISDE